MSCAVRYEAAAPDVALISGLTLRELLRHPAVAELLLRYSQWFKYSETKKKTERGNREEVNQSCRREADRQ